MFRPRPWHAACEVCGRPFPRARVKPTMSTSQLLPFQTPASGQQATTRRLRWAEIDLRVRTLHGLRNRDRYDNSTAELAEARARIADAEALTLGSGTFAEFQTALQRIDGALMLVDATLGAAQARANASFAELLAQQAEERLRSMSGRSGLGHGALHLWEPGAERT